MWRGDREQVRAGDGGSPQIVDGVGEAVVEGDREQPRAYGVRAKYAVG